MRGFVLGVLFLAFVILSATAVTMNEYVIAVVMGVLAAVCAVALAGGKPKEDIDEYGRVRKAGRRR
ncbi:hypothetical protein [Kibdelosporangium aridum]|uniref:Uncharacterized protein n=1 Tax=Kibdelosporangium aridum TaxID=2030 RepID=A0A1Y5XMK3_KIBAR|nr:hypothetical protein [Kibdelosporangium aridum]SMC99086.1 hypothetical protein SAMN05661093_03635 [Kibdelosporangium aridum]